LISPYNLKYLKHIILQTKLHKKYPYQLSY